MNAVSAAVQKASSQKVICSWSTLMAPILTRHCLQALLCIGACIRILAGRGEGSITQHDCAICASASQPNDPQHLLHRSRCLHVPYTAV